MVRSRLAFKVSVLIVVVLILGFGASTILTIQRESALLVEQSKIAARRLTATLVASIEGAMLQERPDVTRTVLQELKTSTPVEGLTVFRRTGVEAFTDLATAMEVNKNAGLAKEVMDNIRKMARPPGETATGPDVHRGAAVAPHPGIAGDAQRCHLLHAALSDPEPGEVPGLPRQPIITVRAVVRVATSMEPVLAEVRRHRNRQILIGAGDDRGRRRRADRGHAPRGDSSHRPARRSPPAGWGRATSRRARRSAPRDEIGQLGAAFNDMTGRLATAYQELEHKNTELTTALQNLQESRERLELLEQLKGELSKFVPEAVKRLLEQNPNATELEKKTVEVSVLFLDIAGYTKLSEQLEPRRLNQLVQTYFSSFLELIQRPARRHQRDGRRRPDGDLPGPARRRPITR